ncbi:MAG: beta-N-acetylhexosaminidase [Nitrosomonas sp.]|nr:MAG: beta-N-acetylhexosaminidase [Nitrosomonas sp.]
MPLGPLMLDIAGTELTVEDRRRLTHPLVGGVILFTRNYTDYRQLSDLTRQIHALRDPHLLIAVDHEGGRVQRFLKDFTKLPVMRELGKLWDRQPGRARHLAKQTGWVLAAELNACGVDFSFTPVLDLDHGQSSVIGDRALHQDPNVVAELAQQLMLGLKRGGMLAVGKHFPGHGYIQADSHVEKAIDLRSYPEIEAQDLIPFQHLIDAGIAGIMAAHVAYPGVDTNPAGFSPIWLQKILRKQLQFEGCIFSDDLTMCGAGAFLESLLLRAQAALAAGCDMILVCNDPDGSDAVLADLQWQMTPASLARLARMHGKNHFGSWIKLRENGEYVQAVREIGAIGCKSGELPLQ